MRKKAIIVLIPAILIGLFSFSVFKNEPNESEKDKLVKEIIFKGLLPQFHFNNLTLDDQFSEKAFDLYMKKLDGNKRFLLKEDIEKLSKYKHSIDDEIRGGSNPLYDISQNLLSQRVAEAEAFYKDILAEPFDFTKDEEVELDPDKRDYCTTSEELKEEWRKYLKYQALVRYQTRLDTQKKKVEQAEKDSDEDFEEKTPAQIDEEVRKDLMKNHDNYFTRLKDVDEDDNASDYLNAMLNVYCPHTEFFPPQDKENFDIGISGKLEGIGAELRQIDGQIKVNRIVPGSASWRQGDLKEEDVIMKVGQGDEEPVSVIGMPLKEAVSLIRGKKGTEVKLTVRKPDGRISNIPIIRDVVVLEESYAKAAIIHDKATDLKTGFIQLPQFYADFSGTGGRSSSEDVKIILEKMNKEKVNSVILDLRQNGGGSLQDAIEMSGLFIKSGPIVQVKSRMGEPYVLEDKNPSITYDGPLAVLSSEFSASASEILASALQDYNRAIIVGSQRTFGKGTVQRFVDLDQSLPPSLSQMKPLGSVKVTIQKFYRITGKSTQWKGVEPDVVLPNLYSEIEIGESSLDHALPWDEIPSQKFNSWDKKFNMEGLVANSQKRVKNDEVFKLVKENALRMKEQQDKTLQTLNLTKFAAEQKMLEKESEKYKNIKREDNDFVISPINYFKQDSELDSIRAESNKNWYKELKENIYISESMNILGDYIKQNDVALSGKDKK